MTSTWFVIDTLGAREVPLTHADPGAWPSFAQLAVRAPAAYVEAAIGVVARRCGVWAPAVTDCTHDILLGDVGAWTLADEPDADLDARLLHAEVADAIIDALEADAVFCAYETEPDSLILLVYQHGSLTLEWRDSSDPCMPSIATSFLPDGRCTHEDPRRFALRTLGLDVHTPVLDRERFVHHVCQNMGHGAPILPLFDIPPVTRLSLRDLNDD